MSGSGVLKNVSNTKLHAQRLLPKGPRDTSARVEDVGGCLINEKNNRVEQDEKGCEFESCTRLRCSSTYTTNAEREKQFAPMVPKHTDATLYSRKKSGFP